MAKPRPRSLEILRRNQRFIPGGVVSVNRAVQPEIVFVRARGQYLWDADGNRYIDYHAAFSPHLLGHNNPHVTAAVERTIHSEASLYGAGTTVLEGRLAELMVAHIPFLESVQFLNTGSEATSQAIRLARAATGRDHIIVIQGGYNGWHDDVACNLMTPLGRLGPRVSPGEYPFVPISAGIPEERRKLVHVVNFNDLASVEYVCEKHPIAALITEPVLQNVGVIRPQPGYLEGLRKLADKHGFLLIFDEVKTGFRSGVGGYAAAAGVRPDIAVYGKAIANGYPIAALGGRRELMDYFVHPDPERRVLLAGTYNAHPIPTAAAIATIEQLTADGGAVYRRLETLSRQLESGLEEIIAELGLPATVVRQASAFCIYFMDHEPIDWHDLAGHHDYALDEALRRELIDAGVYVFPVPTKQISISSAHTTEDVARTLAAFKAALETCLGRAAAQLK